MTLVSLNGDEYFGAIQKTAERGFTSGRVYDALLLTCAAKVRAQTIYTWNAKHFQAIAPELVVRIHTPLPRLSAQPTSSPSPISP